MRTATALMLSAAVLAACSGELTTTPATYALPEDADWMLVTPPENPTVVGLRDALETLPDGRAAVAAGAGVSEREAIAALLAELAEQPTAEARVRHLVERSSERDAPITRWQRVRRFESAERCNATRKELQEVTREGTSKVAVRPGMPMWQLEWAFLEWSNRWSQCVPVDTLEPASN